MSYVTAPPMIAYAGANVPQEARRGYERTMFLMGYDTKQIADHLSIPECMVVRRIQAERDRRLGVKTQFVRAGS